MLSILELKIIGEIYESLTPPAIKEEGRVSINFPVDRGS